MSDRYQVDSPNRLMVQTVWPFVLIVVVLLCATMFGLELMSSVRSYVGGESLWSKGQKQAYISLVNYLLTGSEKDYEDFLGAIAVPLGDNKARLELNKINPDYEIAYQGFIEGKNSPDDVPGMIRLYRYFAHTPIMKEPIRIWAEADTYIIRLRALGNVIHQQISVGNMQDATTSSHVVELNAINLGVTPLEEEFSASIAAVSHKTENLIIVLLILLSLILTGLGLLFSRRLASQRISSSNALRKEAEKNIAFLHNASDGIHILDPVGNVLEVSDSFCDLLGYSRDEIIGMNVTQWDAHFSPADVPGILQKIIDENVRSQFESVHRRKDGVMFDVELSALPVELDGQAYLYCSSRDISERKRNQQQVEYLAYHDQLTGLPNRILFLDRLNQALESARRYNHFGAVLFIDLDKFKSINDVHGHTVGDLVIKEAANRLNNHARKSDTVSRFGGDEFVILLTELSSNQETAASLALLLAEKIRISLENPTRIGAQDYITTASIGVSLYPKEGGSVDDLIRGADIAMYRAKDQGRNTLVFFEPDMQAHIAERYALEQDLRNAILNGELELNFQSQVNKGGEIIGAEALVRWRHPGRGLIMPTTFISLAEDTGFVVQIGEWVLRQTCQCLVQLNKMGRSLRLAVNVSPRQFHQDSFVANVKDILVETGADPLYLTLEVTENLLIDRAAEVVSRMLELSELGIRFSIDDFGTGYSSLSYLKRLPLNELKIDKSFVQDVPHDPNDVALVETVLSMAHHLGFEVVAEGVETNEQFEFLAARKCEYFQGYHFHRPQLGSEWLADLNELPS